MNAQSYCQTRLFISKSFKKQCFKKRKSLCDCHVLFEWSLRELKNYVLLSKQKHFHECNAKQQMRQTKERNTFYAFFELNTVKAELCFSRLHLIILKWLLLRIVITISLIFNAKNKASNLNSQFRNIHKKLLIHAKP